MFMAKIFDTNGNAAGEVELPKVFGTKHRPDVIKKAFLALQSSERQPYGADPLAGKRSSAHYHGRRKYRFTMMNREMARISRLHGKVGYLAFRARVVPQAVKGRRAHPPKAEKNWEQKINRKENELAVKSALAASANLKLLAKRHRIEKLIPPVIIVDDFENIDKTKEIAGFLDKILAEEMKRCKEKKIKPGKGKTRGRKYRKKKGPVVIASKDCPLLRSARNIAGIDAVAVDDINIALLAPGAQAGRLTILTKAALDQLGKRFG